MIPALLHEMIQLNPKEVNAQKGLLRNIARLHPAVTRLQTSAAPCSILIEKERRPRILEK
jgi:hypothetical protein